MFIATLFGMICLTLLSIGVENSRASSAISIPAQVRRPPTIIEQSEEVYYALPLTQIRLKCEADALPAVKKSGGYYWEKNGVWFNVTEVRENNTKLTVIMSEKNGSIYFNGSESLDSDELLPLEGRYQCFARNNWGTAISQFIDLKIGTMVPYVGPADDTLVVNEGESKQVSCSKSMTKDIEIWWNFTPSDVRLSNRIAQAEDGTIVFSNVVAEEDEGLRFYCTQKYLPTRSSIDGAHYTLSVSTDNPAPDMEPDIIRPMQDKEERIFLKDQELTLTCIATGKPTPTVYWSRKEKLLDEEDARYEMVDFNRTLYIRNIRYDDEGTYTCTAKNGLGLRRRDISVVVQAKPYFSKSGEQPTDVIMVPGDTATIRCLPEGIPTPEVRWLVNGRPVTELTESFRGVVYDDKIVVTNLTEEDTAVYQCIGRNKHGMVMGQGFLNVMTSAPFPIDTSPAIYHVMEKTAVDMSCKMFASPEPKYNWTKLDPPEDIVFGNRIKMKKNNALKMIGLNLQDSGTYQCKATNQYGSAIINATLLVLRSTVVRAVHGNGNYKVAVGKEISMMVEIIVHEPLTWKSVTWYKDGYEVANHLMLTLLDVSMEDGGKYIVWVETELDRADTTIILTVQDVPESPEGLVFTESLHDPYSGSLNWESPYRDNNSPINDYRVEYEAVRPYPGVWDIMLETVGGSETRADIFGLEPWTQYRFRVFARNEIGWSVYPSEVTETYETPADEPKVNPVGVKGEGTAPENMVISWDKVDPIKFAGPGFGYEVSWCLESNCTWKEIFVDDPEVTSYVVTNTPTYTRYLINVISSNDIGNAPTPISVVGYSGEDVPEEPPADPQSSVGENGKVTISWKSVPEDKMRGLVTGYRVKIKDKDREEDEEVLVDPNDLSITLDLEPYTNYEFTVFAKNSVGESDPSTVTRLMTPEGLPEAPVDLRLSRKTLRSLELLWKEPKKKNGIITSYRLTHEQEQGNKKIINTTETKLKLEELEPGMTYSLMLCAATSRGLGQDCAALFASTIEPRAPREPQFDVITDDKIANITWMTSPLDEEEGITTKHFVVEHRLANKDAEEWTTMQTILAEEGRWHYGTTIRDLEPSQSYEFRLVSWNEYGNTTTNVTALTAGALQQPATADIMSEIWFIAVLCVSALIVLLIVIVCFMRRRRGKKYSVSEKEEQLVKLESQPMNNDDTGKYSLNPNDDTIQEENGETITSPVTDPMESSRTRGDSVGGNSIEVFGSGDTRDFEEDGSFIEQYGVDRRTHEKTGVESPCSEASKDASDARRKLLSESENVAN